MSTLDMLLDRVFSATPVVKDEKSIQERTGKTAFGVEERTGRCSSAQGSQTIWRAGLDSANALLGPKTVFHTRRNAIRFVDACR